MDEYNFHESLRSMSNSDQNVKKRHSSVRNARFSIGLDAADHNAFRVELSLMKIKFPFLTESQVQGRTLDKFCIPNLMGKPYKKSKSGIITMCTIPYAIQTAKKSQTARKCHSGKPKTEVQRRHTIAGGYLPIDITINKICRRRNTKVLKNLYKAFTLYSDETEDDDYSIQASSTDDSGLEDFNPEFQSHTFGLNFLNKPSEAIKPFKTYEKSKRPPSITNSIANKRNQSYTQRNLKQSSKKDYSNNIESSVISESRVSRNRPKTDRNEVEISEVTEHLQNMITSDYEGDIVENSVNIIDATPDIDERQKAINGSHQLNSNATCVSGVTGTRNKSDVISPNICSRKKKVSSSQHSLKEIASLTSSSRRIKQSISQISSEYFENISTDCSSSALDGTNLNPGYLCGVKCLSTPKQHVPLVKVNLSVYPHDKESLNNSQESTRKKKHKSSIGHLGALRKYRKCSVSVPYVDEASLISNTSENSDSNESPMSEMDEEENETYPTPGSYRNRKSSCSSMESYTMGVQGRYSPYIIQLHSSVESASEGTDAEDDKDLVNHHSHSVDDDFGEIRGNFSPQIAEIQNLPNNGSCTASAWNSQQSDQLSQEIAQATHTAAMRSPENNGLNSEGYFLANLFDEYTNEPGRRSLRSSLGQYSSSQEDDGALTGINGMQHNWEFC